jgi:DNA modification methylase
MGEKLDGCEGSEESKQPDPGVLQVISIIDSHLEEVDDLSSLDEFSGSEHNPKTHDAESVYEYLMTNLPVARDMHGALKDYLEHHGDVTAQDILNQYGDRPESESNDLRLNVEHADACHILPSDAGEDAETAHSTRISLESETVDLIITSPPYWQKRDYEVKGQLGHEDDPEDYIKALLSAMDRWRAFLRPHGSIFLNIGDSYDDNKSRVGIPGMFVHKAREAGWTIRNDIVWTKDSGMPSSAKDRLVPRHEHIIHLVDDKRDYYYDLHGYANVYGNGSNPGDVWRMNHDRNTGGHLAPFPEELARRAIALAGPPSVCTSCGTPRQRIRERGLTELNTDRPQARRAIEIYEDSDLTPEHLKAVQAVGISDAGKAKEFQEGAGENAKDVQELADEAKEVLGGYFREFTFPLWTTAGWTDCECESPNYDRGVVFDPFAGSGTALRVANELGFHAWGTDLDTSNFAQDQSLARYQR